MPGVSYEQVGDHKRLTISQSWLSTWARCQAASGYEFRGEIESTSSDATELGTAYHHYAEQRKLGAIPDQAMWEASELLEIGTQAPDFRWKQIKTLPTLQGRLENLAWTYENELARELGEPHPTMGIEHTFNVPLAVAPNRDEIWVKGTWDWYGMVLDRTTGEYVGPQLADHKTSKPERWDRDKPKFEIQPDIYTYALAYILHGSEAMWLQEPMPFTYLVNLKGPRPCGYERWDTTRGPSDWAWIQQLALHAHKSIQLDSWAPNHQSHLCSPKWCDAWDLCRGTTVKTEQPIELGRKQLEMAA